MNQTRAANFTASVILSVVVGLVALVINYRDVWGPRVQPAVADGKAIFRLAAEDFVRRSLKSPATSVFAPHDDWKFESIDAQTYRMGAWVDSQNSFAAILRGHFTVIVRLSSEGDEVRLMYLKFAESEDAIGEYLLTPEEEELASLFSRLEQEAEEKKRMQQADADAVERERIRAEEAARREEDERLRIAAKKLEQQRIARLQAEADERQRRAAEATAWKRMLEEARDAGEYRTWLSSELSSPLEARPIKYRNGILTVETREGVRSDLKVELLSAADREFFAKWRRERAK